MLRSSFQAAPLVLVGIFMLLNVWYQRKKRQIESRHGSKIVIRECPWCGKKVNSGLAMLAHVDNLHNGGKVR